MSDTSGIQYKLYIYTWYNGKNNNSKKKCMMGSKYKYVKIHNYINVIMQVIHGYENDKRLISWTFTELFLTL